MCPTVNISDNDQVSSALLKSSQRSKSPMATNPNLIPAHTYYTRSKSVYDKLKGSVCFNIINYIILF